MTETFTALKSITIDVPAGKVWEALTNPAMIQKYLLGTNVTSNWKVGSKIIYRGEWKGKTYEDKGEILQMIPNKLFQSTFWSGSSGMEDKPENYAVVTWELEETNGSTNVSVSQDRCPSREACKDAEENWGQVLESMKRLLENWQK